MAKKSKSPSPFEGRWHIVSMSDWHEDYIDEKAEGYIEFNGEGGGKLQFDYGRGDMDCKPTTREGEPAVEWTWGDERYPAQGGGRAVLKGEELHGMNFFHGGGISEFVASRAGRAKPPKGK